MSISLSQLRDLAERSLFELDPVLASAAAIELVIGTAAHESGLGTYIRQVRGPALGICQMEPATFLDISRRYLDARPELVSRMVALGYPRKPAALEWDIRLALVMCRLHYRRVPTPLPIAGDWEGQAHYWKRHYNTMAGAGTVEQYMRDLKKYAIIV